MSWFSWWPRRRKASPAEPAIAADIPVRGRAGISLEQGPYALPNDLGEAKRLDLQHYILRQILQSNTVAPISNPRRILDAGCGTGRWAIEIARQFPQAEVVGVDIVAPERAYNDDDPVPAN
ncbi:MAG TPA: methyltransferase domain-containing protein, partial [Ktedonobacterales bacterium]|nr:methyltransferase domain-containing protein [Ktedonobacterales bacterium]